MNTFKHIDNEAFYPNNSEHVDYSVVYRATKNTKNLCVSDFLPSSVEHANQIKTFKRKLVKADYGLSVFTDLNALKDTLNRFPALDAKINAFAQGFTTIKRGISPKENCNHHVEYYLYDYELNSPKDDFHVIEAKNT